MEEEEEEDPSHFHLTTYFDKVLDSLFNQNLIKALSSPQNKSQRLSRLSHEKGYNEDQEISYRVESIEIKSENKAKIAAKKIFQNVAKPGSEDINLEDIERFMQKDEAWKTMGLIEGGPESNKICESTLKRWVVKAFKDWEALRLTIINKLHQAVNFLLSIIIQMLPRIAPREFLRYPQLSSYLQFIHLMLVTFVRLITFGRQRKRSTSSIPFSYHFPEI